MLRPISKEWRDTFPDVHPVLARVYSRRNVASVDELEYGLDRLPPFQKMKGIGDAIDILVEAIENQQCILIVGDFDCDGATSTTVAVRGLRLMGAENVSFLVPNRFEYGYGLTPEIVEVAAQQSPDIIVTVDNGIASIEGVAAAKAKGIKVVVTDHHLPGETLPDADAIVNPSQPGCEFPTKAMAGVGVIFYIMMALRCALRDSGFFRQRGLLQPNLAQLLDLVALGTVADVVPLDQTNRVFVSQGLARIRRGQCCAGIDALLKVGCRQRERIVASDLGFVVGPRLNAAGRLEDMSIGIDCLLTESPQEALDIATTLDELNRERRSIERDMQDQAMLALGELQFDDEQKLPTGLCLYQSDWHQGVIGILASRIKDLFHRPVIAFADADEQNLKGSARSVQGFHIRDGLDAIATRHPELIQKFGGHAMAAGLSIKKEHLEEFSHAFDKEVEHHLNQDDLRGRVWTDGELESSDFSLDVAEVLRKGGPWGQAFPEPVFEGRFELIDRRIVGERHLKMQLKPIGGEFPINAIAFNSDDHHWPAHVSEVQLAYKLDVNEFRGSRDVQLLVDLIEPL
ncbi:single-stranded-DNA-specific exonuclease RecJ [Pseudomonadota bacterium]